MLHSKSMYNNYDGDSEDDSDHEVSRISNLEAKKVVNRSKSRSKWGSHQYQNERTPKGGTRDQIFQQNSSNTAVT
jgi:hypothetical protein